ncbi:hypothetical protein ACSQ67_000535 [Phaseolus vulgaris]
MEEPPEEPSQSQESWQDHHTWITTQDILREKLITEDSFSWKLSTKGASQGEPGYEKGEELRYVGGVDISFSKDDPSKACGTLVVLDFHTLQLLYQDFSFVTLQVPYVPGFLAFREAPVLQQLLEKMKRSDNPFYPQVMFITSRKIHMNLLLMVDGNGILHPRGKYILQTNIMHSRYKSRAQDFFIQEFFPFLKNVLGWPVILELRPISQQLGLERMLVIFGLLTLYMFQLHHVDGLTHSTVRKLLGAEENSSKDFINLVGDSGRIWGVAMRSTQGSIKPIFISIGHMISLQTAITIVQKTCKFRVPEPIRQADIRSRDYIRKLGMNGKVT